MKTGLDVLQDQEFALLAGKRVGLLTHPAAVNRGVESTLDVLARQDSFTLSALFGPEHGLHGDAQDMIAVSGERERAIRVHSLYGSSFASLTPTPKMLEDLEVFVIDLVDVGSRYYTFHTTMLFCMGVCAKQGIPVVVLDRPNPLGRAIEGPQIRRGFESFVGWHSLCIRHGMSMGELALMYRSEAVPGVDLTVIPYQPADAQVENWWVPPSPNMPTIHTALVYPGMCLFEGTNLSEGRGTTRPFETIGFPNVDGRRVAEECKWEDFDFTCLPATFTPTFHKHAGQHCGGVRVIPRNADGRSVLAGILLLMAFKDVMGDAFCWRTETYEYVSHIPAIDLLFGSDRERIRIDGGASYLTVIEHWAEEEAAFRERRKPFLLY